MKRLKSGFFFFLQSSNLKCIEPDLALNNQSAAFQSYENSKKQLLAALRNELGLPLKRLACRVAALLDEPQDILY